jgi:hypothetical protein
VAGEEDKNISAGCESFMAGAAAGDENGAEREYRAG